MTVEIWLLISFIIFVVGLWLSPARVGILKFLDDKIHLINKEITESESIRDDAQEDLKKAQEELINLGMRCQEIIDNNEKMIAALYRDAEVKIKNIEKKRRMMLEQAVQQHRDQEARKLKKTILFKAISEARVLLSNDDSIDNIKLYNEKCQILGTHYHNN